MKLKAIALGLVCALSLSAEYNLKDNMYLLQGHLSTMQNGLINGNDDEVKSATSNLIEQNNKMFVSEDKIQDILPKNKKHMYPVAVQSARAINEQGKEILTNLKNGNRYKAQEAFLAVTHSCMKCHNIVRD